MKLYVSQGTNPRVVQLFLSLKGIQLETIPVDIGKGDNRQPDFLAKNYLGQLPVLELDSGQCISQITAICEYLEEIYPLPALIGTTPDERAETRMWLRRNDLLIIEPAVQAFRYSVALFYFQPLTHCIPDAVEDFKTIVQLNLAQLNPQLQNRTWLCGDRFTLADIQLCCFLAFAASNGQVIDPQNTAVVTWFDRAARELGL